MPKTILIIEDSKDIGGAMKLLIEMEGYDVAMATTGAAGLSLAEAGGIDLILVDLALPDASGIDVTRELRQIPAVAGVPILCVSSHTQGIESVVRAAGCTEVFSKSTFIESFRSTLKRYLGDEALATHV